MSNQWTQGRGNPQQQQWGLPPGAMNQPNQGWAVPPQGGDSQWGAMQQASLMHQQLHQQSRFPAPQQPGYHGYPQGNPQYPQQAPMSQGAYIQEQLAKAREEQKAREVELQKRKMMNMNIAEATPPTSIDRLIGLTDISSKPQKKVPTQQKAPVTMTTTLPPSKPRSWTMDTSNFQGVFRQEEKEDTFGEFQGPPPLQQPSGVGVVPTSSYTRPIPSVSGSPRMTQRMRSTSSPHSTPTQPHKAPSHTSQPHRAPDVTNVSAFPPLYMEVYNRCLKDGSLETELLFPVLMSSKLPRQKLGELWQQANRQTPGKLTQTELFVLLGLIGLVQMGNPNPHFSDLQKVSSPPVPVLEEMRRKEPVSTIQPPAPPTDDFGSFQQGPSPFSLSQTTSFGSPALIPASRTVTMATPSTSSKTNASGGKSTSASGSSLSTFISAPMTSKPLISAPLTSTPLIPTPMTISKPSTSSNKPTSSSKPSVSTNKPSANSNKPSTIKHESPPVSSSDDLTSNFGSFMSGTMSSQNQFADLSTSSANAEGWADFTVPFSTISTQSHTSHTSQPTITQSHTTPSGLDSLLTSQPSLTTTTPSLLPPVTTVEGSPKQEKRPLTGLDILNEEMAARLLSEDTSSRAVDDKPLVPESLDDFGEFEAFGGVQVNGVPSQESAKDNQKPTSDPCEVWRTCLVKCGEVLEKCVSVFQNAEEAELLVEIAESEEGRNKLRGVVEVYRLARRVYSSLRAKDPGVERAGYVMAVLSHWSSLQAQLPNNVMMQLYSETTPTRGDESEATDVLSDSISQCSLCQIGKRVEISAQNSLDKKEEDYPLCLLFHNSQSYHASCANFWINVVQEQLPAL